MKKEIIFHELSKQEQNNIRRKYKEECKNDYDYSIRLYVIYSVLGFFVLLGLIIMLFKDVMIGSLIFVISLILMIIDVYFLYRSNYVFFRFLKRNGYIYDRKKR